MRSVQESRDWWTLLLYECLLQVLQQVARMLLAVSYPLLVMDVLKS